MQHVMVNLLHADCDELLTPCYFLPVTAWHAGVSLVFARISASAAAAADASGSRGDDTSGRSCRPRTS